MARLLIFRLDLNQGIYISSEEGEIILPSDTGFYHVEDLEKTYFINGERMSKNTVSSVVPAVQSTALGKPLSYQRTATRTNLNPPHGQSAQVVLKRPTFTTTKKRVKWHGRNRLLWWTCCRLEKLRKVPSAYVAHRRNFVGR